MKHSIFHNCQQNHYKVEKKPVENNFVKSNYAVKYSRAVPEG